MFYNLLMAATDLTTVTETFSGLDFSGMVTIATSIVPVAVAAALPIWTLKFGWNFLKGMITGL